MFQKQQTGRRLCPEAMRISPLSRILLKEEINWAMAHERHHSGSSVQSISTRRIIKLRESSRFLHPSAATTCLYRFDSWKTEEVYYTPVHGHVHQYSRPRLFLGSVSMSYQLTGQMATGRKIGMSGPTSRIIVFVILVLLVDNHRFYLRDNRIGVGARSRTHKELAQCRKCS